jgi:glycosyl transferase family 2
VIPEAAPLLDLDSSTREPHRSAHGQRTAAGLCLADQDQWQVEQGGHWLWQGTDLTVSPDGSEWASLTSRVLDGAALTDLRNVVIEATVGGTGEVAGLSFGHYKDFLAPLASHASPRHLQLEIDLVSGWWAFRIDGRLQERQWWDSGIGSTADFLSGALTLKARRVEDVRFRNLVVRTLDASCRLSVVITCYRFLQRLRLSLRNWCHQDLPSGSYEIIVVNPESPDGTHEHLAAVARSHPHIRIREIAVDEAMATNKGAMINHALNAASGEWIWITDADCLFAPGCAATVLASMDGRANHLSYGERRFLSQAQTDALLAGRLDPLRQFHELAASSTSRQAEASPWGYTQIVNQSAISGIRYREDLNHFAHSDGMFVADCTRHAITPRQLDGLFCLHMDHPFAWYGTRTFL